MGTAGSPVLPSPDSSEPGTEGSQKGLPSSFHFRKALVSLRLGPPETVKRSCLQAAPGSHTELRMAQEAGRIGRTSQHSIGMALTLRPRVDSTSRCWCLSEGSSWGWFQRRLWRRERVGRWAGRLAWRPSPQRGLR